MMFVNGPRIAITSSEVVVREIHSIPGRRNPIIPGRPSILLRMGLAGYQEEAVLTRGAAETLRDRLVEQLGPTGNTPCYSTHETGQRLPLTSKRGEELMTQQKTETAGHHPNSPLALQFLMESHLEPNFQNGNALEHHGDPEKTAGGRIAFIQDHLEFPQERMGLNRREARAFLAREIARHDTGYFRDTLMWQLGEQHPGLLTEALRALCSQRLADDPSEKEAQRDLRLLHSNMNRPDGTTVKQPPPGEIQGELEQALNNGDQDRTIRAYQELKELRTAVRRLPKQLGSEIEASVMEELEKYWSRNLIEQSDWIQVRLQANPAGSNQVEALARFHLELALTIVEGYLAYGGHPSGLRPAIRISLTLDELHRRRSGWDNQRWSIR